MDGKTAVGLRSEGSNSLKRTVETLTLGDTLYIERKVLNI